jgi:hypothetical protein
MWMVLIIYCLYIITVTMYVLNMVLYLLLVFPGTGFEPNESSSNLLGQADSIEFLGNFRATLFIWQVL